MKPDDFIFPEAPQPFKTGRGWITEEAREFLIQLIFENPWMKSNHISEAYDISMHAANRLRHSANYKRRFPLYPNGFGHRNDQYYTEDYLLNGVSYNVEDLQGAELEILEGLPDEEND